MPRAERIEAGLREIKQEIGDAHCGDPGHDTTNHLIAAVMGLVA